MCVCAPSRGKLLLFAVNQLLKKLWSFFSHHFLPLLPNYCRRLVGGEGASSGTAYLQHHTVSNVQGVRLFEQRILCEFRQSELPLWAHCSIGSRHYYWLNDHIWVINLWSTSRNESFHCAHTHRLTLSLHLTWLSFSLALRFIVLMRNVLIPMSIY